MTQTAADIFRPRAGARVRILQKARKPENQKTKSILTKPKDKRQSQTEQKQNKEPGDMTT